MFFHLSVSAMSVAPWIGCDHPLRKFCMRASTTTDPPRVWTLFFGTGSQVSLALVGGTPGPEAIAASVDRLFFNCDDAAEALGKLPPFSEPCGTLCFRALLSVSLNCVRVADVACQVPRSHQLYA